MFEFAVKRPVSVSIIMLMMVGLGLYFGSKLKLEFFPTLDIPVVTVITVYQGAGPEEIEEQVTKKIEDQVGTVAQLKKLRSTSQDNVSIVIAEFYYGTNMIQALADVRDKVELAKMALPDEVRQPIVNKVDPASSPIMTVTLSGEMDLRTLRTLGDDDIKKELEKLPGVASVTVSGGFEREISVLVDPGKLKQFNIAPSKVITAIQLENINVPAGNILTTDQQIQVRTVGQFNNVDELKEVYVDDAGSRRIYIKDIAEVRDTNKEQTSISRINGIPCVALQIRRNTDSNVVEVCDGVRAAVDRINKVLPMGAKLAVVSDDSDMVKKSVHAMQETAVEATLLAVFVIFMFLSSFRSTIIVSLSIPISIFSTFIMMNFCNLSLNIITLSAFTLAIGRVVDDSIVVLENIFRFIEMGHDPVYSAINGTKEVGLAVLASTFTTMSVFLPLLIVKGIAGQIFTPLALTFMTALLVSLIVAVLLIPMLCSRVLKPEEHNKPKKGFKVLTAKWQEGFGYIERLYERALGWSINHKFIVLASAFAIFVVSIMALGKIPVAFQPKIDHGYVSCSIESAVGTSLQKTDSYVKEIERIANSEFEKEIEFNVGQVGTSSSAVAFGSGSEDSMVGGVSLFLINKKERKRNAMQLQDILREKLSGIPGIIAKTTISSRQGSGAADVEMVLKGDDLDELATLGEKYKDMIGKQIPGAAELDLSWKKGKPEYRIKVDRVKSAQYGVNLYDVGSSIGTFVRGYQVADINKYKEGGRDYDITVQIDRVNRDTLAKLEQLPIRISDNLTVPLANIATIEQTDAPSKILRESRARCVSVQGTAAEGYQNNQVVQGIVKLMAENPLPEGYTWSIGGEEESRSESFGDLFSSLILAVFLVYAILAIQFESFIHPLTIMMAVPLEIIGVVVALVVTGEPVSMVIILALIMLTGIVVSNSILLINYILVLRHEHNLPRTEAILKAGPVRLRPILMTSIATCIAMLPLAMAIREGGEFFAPLGKVVIGGLISSTFFTLLVVPCFYVVMDNIGRRLGLVEKEEAKPQQAQGA